MSKIKAVIIYLILLVFFISCGTNNTDSKNSTGKWIYLFDGTSTEGWRGHGKDAFPEEGWIIEDSTLRCVAGTGGGNIIYDRKFSNFELSFEWKISEAGNSGVFILGQELPFSSDPFYVMPGGDTIFMEVIPTFDAIHRSAPEFQILDNDKHPDANMGRDGNRTAASLYDLIPANPLTSSNPVGEWNRSMIIVNNGKVTHINNGITVIEYELWTDEWHEMVANSKFKDMPDFANPAKEGYIGLQDHGNDVWFRNIKIREL